MYGLWIKVKIYLYFFNFVLDSDIFIIMLLLLSKLYTQIGAWIHDPMIKSCMHYRPRKLDAPSYVFILGWCFAVVVKRSHWFKCQQCPLSPNCEQSQGACQQTQMDKEDVIHLYDGGLWLHAFFFFFFSQPPQKGFL